MIIVAGSPGAGKTTQCKILAEKHGYIWISAGELLRKYADGEHRETMLQGNLVEDSYVDALVGKEMDKHTDNEGMILLDGFPRDFYEARWLVEEYCANVSAYVFIEIKEPVVVERLLGRGRKDDTPEAIKERLEVFNEETKGIVDFYAERGVAIHRIDGAQEIEAVQADLREALEIG